MLLKSFSTTKFAESKIEERVFTAIDFEEVGFGDLNASVAHQYKIVDGLSFVTFVVDAIEAVPCSNVRFVEHHSFPFRAHPGWRPDTNGRFTRRLVQRSMLRLNAFQL
jgi:hypothetical protein